MQKDTEQNWDNWHESLVTNSEPIMLSRKTDRSALNLKPLSEVATGIEPLFCEEYSRRLNVEAQKTAEVWRLNSERNAQK